MSGILFEGENMTDEQRAAQARKLSEDNRAEALLRLAEIKARVGERKLAKAERVTGEVLDIVWFQRGGTTRTRSRRATSCGLSTWRDAKASTSCAMTCSIPRTAIMRAIRSSSTGRSISVRASSCTPTSATC
jgi:hypothetical protein